MGPIARSNVNARIVGSVIMSLEVVIVFLVSLERIVRSLVLLDFTDRIAHLSVNVGTEESAERMMAFVRVLQGIWVTIVMTVSFIQILLLML